MSVTEPPVFGRQSLEGLLLWVARRPRGVSFTVGAECERAPFFLGETYGLVSRWRAQRRSHRQARRSDKRAVRTRRLRSPGIRPTICTRTGFMAPAPHVASAPRAAITGSGSYATTPSIAPRAVEVEGARHVRGGQAMRRRKVSRPGSRQTGLALRGPTSDGLDRPDSAWIAIPNST